MWADSRRGALHWVGFRSYTTKVSRIIVNLHNNSAYTNQFILSQRFDREK